MQIYTRNILCFFYYVCAFENLSLIHNIPSARRAKNMLWSLELPVHTLEGWWKLSPYSQQNHDWDFLGTTSSHPAVNFILNGATKVVFGSIAEAATKRVKNTSPGCGIWCLLKNLSSVSMTEFLLHTS